ncbi:MAG: PHP domain-containing protein [Clostridiales bacterium]|nr:PHP domain-containing protein [Clostridiales bacterium]
MIQDLHAHTYYSFCCQDKPETVIETAIASGIQQLGICDHSYGVGCARTELCWDKGTRLDANYENTLVRYFDHMRLLRDKYAKRIKILCGIEVCTLMGKDSYALPYSADISFFDFALVENLDDPNSFLNGDIFDFAKRWGCPIGIAHTDLFKFCAMRGEEPNRYFKRLAEAGIFWEINVNYDSLHSFKQHDYVSEFFKNKTQQEIVKKSGIKLSVGFDGHIAREYKPQKVKTACQLIQNMGIKLAFENKIF